MNPGFAGCLQKDRWIRPVLVYLTPPHIRLLCQIASWAQMQGCDDTKYPVDYEALAKAAKKYHVLLEINNGSLSPDGYREWSQDNNVPLMAYKKSSRSAREYEALAEEIEDCL